MAIQYSIAADVFDISTYSPKPEDSFLVDSNVWFWMTYTNASQSVEEWRKPLVAIYPQFVNNALISGSALFWCGLSIAELAHLIEKTEREIFDTALKAKEFRHNYSNERTIMVTEVLASWGQVKSMATSLDFDINETTSDNALKRFQNQKIDGYDAFILEAMQINNITQIITDDGDFATIPNLQVYTANRNVLSLARDQGKLLNR